MEIVKYSKEFYDHFRNQANVVLKSKRCPTNAKFEYLNSLKFVTSFEEYLTEYFKLLRAYESFGT